MFLISSFMMGVFDLEFFKWSLPARKLKMLAHVAIVIESEMRYTAHGSS